MKKSKKRRGIGAAVVVLVIVLAAVAALIVWKRLEYSASADFYHGLRSAFRSGGVMA